MIDQRILAVAAVIGVVFAGAGYFIASQPAQPNDTPVQNQSNWNVIEPYEVSTSGNQINIAGTGPTGSVATYEFDEAYNTSFTISFEMKGQDVGLMFGTPSEWITLGMVHHNGTNWQSAGGDWVDIQHSPRNMTGDWVRYEATIQNWETQSSQGFYGDDQQFGALYMGIRNPEPITHMGLCNVGTMQIKNGTQVDRGGSNPDDRLYNAVSFEEGAVCNEIGVTDLDEVESMDMSVRNVQIEEIQ